MKKIMIPLICLLFISKIDAQSPNDNLLKLGIKLPTPAAPIANYVKFVQVGKLIYLSGHGPILSNGNYLTGKLGKDVSVEQGYEAAKLCGEALLSTLQMAIGDLSKVKRIVKATGFVNSTETFTDQPKVINGFSDLMVAVFEDKGRHARSAVGTASLPLNMAVEIELIVEIE
jgi:enamine deaminase RidA (YjgF/YER057c/UK114 family)